MPTVHVSVKPRSEPEVKEDVFATKMLANKLWNVDDQSTKQNVTYKRYTKEEILDAMKAPSTTASAKLLRDASIYMYDASSQYRRLIDYFAGLPLWAYVLSPVSYTRKKSNDSAFGKQYIKVSDKVESMNLKHELHKALKITLREGILYGVIWSTPTSFCIQRINPDYCTITSQLDGTWVYSVDMSKIRENQLEFYPPEFKTMYENYSVRKESKWQEVPSAISFCLKADETTVTYSIPPWCSCLPLLYDIETYKALQETKSKIENYKLLAMHIPVHDHVPEVDWPIAEKYFRQMGNALPDYVGSVISPLEIKDFNFEKSGAINSIDIVSRAEEQYWFTTGTSPLLHGSKTADNAGTLNLSIRSDEEIIRPLMVQAERLVNRLLKNDTATLKFKISFLPATVFNQKELIAYYKEAATLGLPGAKSAYAAILGISPMELEGLNYLELDLMGLTEENLHPLKSGYTIGVGAKTDTVDTQKGAPEKDPEDLTESGQETRDAGSNANR
ncbi:MAG TPA: hypothetical protein PLT28_00475 [Saprospiraceae bacterium]|nr:hypothetical protein [Saprospiraceae bacterium]